MAIEEKIIFGDFDSENMGFDMSSRTPDSLQEQEITETIPGVQGSIDYSMMFGQRIFQAFKITYDFVKYCPTYAERHTLEALVKNKIMRFGTTKLYDSNIPENYYFLAKCSSETVAVNDQTREVTVTLAFTCNPPFMFCEIPEGNDEWDTFNFDYDVSQETSFTVNNGDVVPLINNGSAAVQPKITVTGTIKVSCNGNEVTFTAGTYENTLIYLLPGMNSLTLTGTGTISFEFFKELVA
ncbi:hypothetical protein [Lactobacillus amylolyticus]|uniref:hypothetical protein n=1 Tax=Lactobacillus amylolyticus TaxID=83683 RepID=UPI0024908E0C|nr:hypothetical protein [Lactobacillus amylolyticus]